MAKELFLSLKTQYTSTKKPTFDVCVDGVSIKPYEIINLGEPWQQHLFQQMASDINQIDIVFHNKLPGDTVTDSNGQIIEDMLLVIDHLRIDHVDLTQKLNKISVYTDITGQRHYTNNYIAFAGRYRIKLHHNLLYTEWLASLC